MVKIKTQKTMSLPKLIEWGFENDVTNTWYRASNVEEYISEVFFNESGLPQFSSTVDKSDTFTVEIEEELTEYTVIPKLMTTFKKTYLENGFGYQRARIDEDYTIKLMLDKAGMHGESVKTLHIVNDDGTHTLIWRDGRLVE